jgi:hypothetical protein
MTKVKEVFANAQAVVEKVVVKIVHAVRGCSAEEPTEIRGATPEDFLRRPFAAAFIEQAHNITIGHMRSKSADWPSLRIMLAYLAFTQWLRPEPGAPTQGQALLYRLDDALTRLTCDTPDAPTDDVVEDMRQLWLAKVQKRSTEFMNESEVTIFDGLVDSLAETVATFEALE